MQSNTQNCGQNSGFHARLGWYGQSPHTTAQLPSEVDCNSTSQKIETKTAELRTKRAFGTLFQSCSLSLGSIPFRLRFFSINAEVQTTSTASELPLHGKKQTGSQVHSQHRFLPRNVLCQRPGAGRKISPGLERWLQCVWREGWVFKTASSGDFFAFN